MNDIMDSIKNEAVKMDRYMRSDLEGMKENIDPHLYEVLEYGLFAGGKRIRPILLLIASRLCGDRSEDAYRLAIAFEYLHAATLFHDDIIDKSETRRGRPSVYKKFALISAILAGDFLHAHSISVVARYSGREGVVCFCRATKGMADGEIMQLRHLAEQNLSQLDYYRTIMGKTGLLIAAACEIGAIYAGATREQAAALRCYGEKLGCAFQIVDDLLDYLGDSVRTGKMIGQDLAEGKATLPFLLALEKADKDDRELLLSALGTAEASRERIGSVIDTIEKYQGFDGAREQAGSMVQEAVEVLAIFSQDEVRKYREMLEAIANYVLHRNK